MNFSGSLSPINLYVIKFLWPSTLLNVINEYEISIWPLQTFSKLVLNFFRRNYDLICQGWKLLSCLNCQVTFLQVAETNIAGGGEEERGQKKWAIVDWYPELFYASFQFLHFFTITLQNFRRVFFWTSLFFIFHTDY